MVKAWGCQHKFFYRYAKGRKNAELNYTLNIDCSHTEDKIAMGKEIVTFSNSLYTKNPSPKAWFPNGKENC